MEDRKAALLRSRIDAGAGAAGSLLLSDLVGLYWKSLEHEQKREGSKKTDRVSSGPVLRLLGSVPVELLSVPVIQGYLDKRRLEPGRRGGKVSGATIRRERCFLNGVLRFGLRRGLVKNNPTADGRAFIQPKVKSRTAVLTDEQMAKMVEIADHWARTERRFNQSFPLWLRVLFETGMRPGECVRMEWAWMDEEGECIVVPGESHKNHKQRAVIVSGPLWRRLLEQMERAKTERTPYLFYSSKYPQQPISTTHSWRRVAQLAGVPEEAVAHSARHTAITNLFKYSGMSEKQVAVFAGDVSTASLKPYTHLDVRDMRGHVVEFQRQRNREIAKASGWAEKLRAMFGGDADEAVDAFVERLANVGKSVRFEEDEG
jgi:integrase